MNKCPNCFYEFDSWNECVAINNILECPECEEHFELKAVPLNQPQLTIPKSVAEQADKTDLDTLFKWGQQEFYQWFNHEQDEYMPVIYAYLAGKSLGVDLVKVVDD